MNGNETQKAADKQRRPKAATSVLAALLATCLVVGIIAMLFFTFSGSPTVLGNYVIVGPECDTHDAVRVESSYLAARAKPGSPAGNVGLADFAGIKFYRNVPWGPKEQQAAIGPR